MIKRLIKVIGFLPVSALSILQLPIATIQWVVTGVFPNPILKYFIEW